MLSLVMRDGFSGGCDGSIKSEQEEQTLRRRTFTSKIERKKKIMLVTPLKYTSVTQSVLCPIF